MDIGEVKVQFRNYLEHQTQQKKRQKMANETTIVPNNETTIAPKYIPTPNASMSLCATINDIHQADILYLPHDKYEKKRYKYALNIVDVASRYQGSYQLTTKNSKEVAQAFSVDICKYILNLSKDTDN